MNPGDSLAADRQGVNAEARRQHAADEHGEHHRVAELPPRIELEKRIDDRPPHDRRIEQWVEIWLQSLVDHGEFRDEVVESDRSL